jgi:ABC-type bacteriocin/lantibiotic exporter with double-glycine peptidase domain
MVSPCMLSIAEILTRLIVVAAPYVAKPSLTSIFKTGSQMKKESRMQKENQIQVIESIMGRVPVKDRARVGEMTLLWRRRVPENEQSTVLTHVQVCLPH